MSPESILMYIPLCTGSYCTQGLYLCRERRCDVKNVLTMCDYFGSLRIQTLHSPYLNTIPQLIKNPWQPILTVWESVLCYPLICILSSLSSDGCNLCRSTKVHLKILITIVMPWAPSSLVPSTGGEMQASQIGTVIFVPWRRGRDSIVRNPAILHSKRVLAGF